MQRYFVGLVVFALLAASWYLLPRGRQAIAQEFPHTEVQPHIPAIQHSVQQVAPSRIPAASGNADRAAGLAVRVNGLIPKGEVFVAVFEKANEFPNRDIATHTQSSPVNSKQAQVRFENLPPGKYAVAIFQDLNRDGLLNKSTFGAPTEPYGFSNNVRGSFGPPSFQAAAFTLSSGGKDIEVTVH